MVQLLLPSVRLEEPLLSVPIARPQAEFLLLVLMVVLVESAQVLARQSILPAPEEAAAVRVAALVCMVLVVLRLLVAADMGILTLLAVPVETTVVAAEAVPLVPRE